MRLDIKHALRWGLALSVFTHISAAALLGRFGMSFDKESSPVEVEILVEGNSAETTLARPSQPVQSPKKNKQTPKKLQTNPEPTLAQSEELTVQKNETTDSKDFETEAEDWDRLIQQSNQALLTGRALSASEKYTMELRRALNQRLVYPTIAKRLRQRGRVIVRFWLKNDGRLLKTEVVEKSKFDVFNKAAEDLVKEIDGLKPFPDELQEKKVWAFSIPIEYDI